MFRSGITSFLHRGCDANVVVFPFDVGIVLFVNLVSLRRCLARTLLTMKDLIMVTEGHPKGNFKEPESILILILTVVILSTY